MAVLHSIADGNLSSAATWGLVDATSYLDSRVTIQSLSTTQTNSTTTFIPGAITVLGILLQVGGRANSPTGTMTARLFNNTTSLVVKDVVINVIDLPNTTAGTNAYVGWTYFKFDSPVTLVAGNSYSIRAFVSVNFEVGVYRDGTTNNWSRGLVTTTTQSPVATDITITGGQYLSAGVNSTNTVTMNVTSLATQYGNLYVGSNGIFSYGIAASTNYALKLAGNIYIGRGGIFTIGTVANPIPATSTAVLEINCASALQYQFYNFGTLETKYETTVLHRALLNADIAVGAVTSTTAVSTGWKINDVIVIPSTTRTTTQIDRLTLSANAVGTTLSHPATSFAHDGNATIYMQADIVNLTRSIKIRSTNGAFKSRFQQGLYGITTFFDVEFFEWAAFIHNGGTATYAGTLNLQQCSFWQIAAPGTETVLYYLSPSISTISNNVFYSYGGGTNSIDNNNVIIGFTGFQAWAGNLGDNNVISSCSASGWAGNPKNGSTGNKFYATGGNGALYTSSSLNSYTVSNYIFFNNSLAIRFYTNTITVGTDRTFFEKWENCYFYGNVNTIDFGGSPGLFRRLWFNNCYYWGGKTGLITANGLVPYANDYTHFSNCTFGRRPDGVDSFFSTSCLRGGQYGITLTNCLFYGTQMSFASATGFSSVNGFQGVTSLKHNGVVNDHRLVQSNGYAQPDSVITYNGTRTIRITPQVATNKTFSNPGRIAVSSGQTCNVTIAIRKSVLADGTAYNGNQPRLMYAFNPLAGNLTETVGVSATVASNGAWEILTYTTPAVSNDCVLEFYIDCDGTTGWINIDDFKTTTSNDTRGMEYWSTVGVYVEPDWRKPGGSYAFFN
jgi:hypothetical protein